MKLSLSNYEEYSSIISKINSFETPIHLEGVIDTQKAHFISNVNDKATIVITYSPLKAQEIYRDLLYFTQLNEFSNSVYLFPSRDMVFYHAHVKSMDITKQRIKTLSGIIKDENPIIVMSGEAILDPVTPRDIFEKSMFTISELDIFDTSELIFKMINLGYERVDMVEMPTQFAMRGGILDFYDIFTSSICRIEFFGDEVDSIRYVDIESQRSTDKTSSITIYPASGLVFTKDFGENVLAEIEEEYNKTAACFKSSGKNEELDNLNSSVGMNIQKLKLALNNDKSQKTDILSANNFDSFLYYFYKEKSSIFDYFKTSCNIFIDEPNKVSEYLSRFELEFNESLVSRMEKGYLLNIQNKIIHSYNDVLNEASILGNKHNLILMSYYNTEIKDFNALHKFHLAVSPFGAIKNKLDMLAIHLKSLCSKENAVLILIPIEARAKRISEELRDLGVVANFSLDLDILEKGKVLISIGSINSSFTYNDINLTVISHRDLFGTTSSVTRKKKKKKRTKSSIINSFLDLNVGDFIVHDTHGIGVYHGIEKIVVDNISKDYLKLSYKNGGIIYVAANQLDAVQKFIGSEGKAPKLNSLGGKEFSQMKAKAKEATLELARELVQLYSMRQNTKGFVFSCDTPWQHEFEEAFPHDETDDQLTATEEIKKDMESPIVMDRLLCGDVGYGKTEVALRCAFKAIQDGKQVAILAPTTILAQQHYQTFSERMKDYPVTIGIMSRFRTPKQQRQTITQLQTGTVDILIGTHRILSSDIVFYNLGLIIIDEEQRFGVAHKEKLKQFTNNVDALSLSATPIPRTLHMSLSGIRDMSLLEDPPSERKPIQTFVMEYQEEFIKDAIVRELARGGQVYFLHNRVRSIEKYAKKIIELVPEARVAVAHGQMSKAELEAVMNDFLEGLLDVLICTTIIETGLDIPNVNTIIINDADKMGLSQLYQLRGRVGRSDRLAYAYLMFKKDKVLDETAEKRLRTISEFTEFGSGFKIAMRDLEIRGAGNLLGKKQHGQMDTVGYDMYCKLLNDAVRLEKGEIVLEEWFTTVDIDINAFIPTNYIENESMRLGIYKKISNIVTREDFYAMQEELEDRFGNLPEAVNNLLDIALLKSTAHLANISAVNQKTRGIIFTIRNGIDVSLIPVENIIAKNKNKFKFKTNNDPQNPINTITYELSKGELMPTVNTLIDYIASLVV